MSKNDRSWIPDAVDLDWIESLAAPPSPALAAIEAAAEPLRIPIVDRDAGRVLSVLAGDPAADRRGRHGVRLLDALDGPRPAGRRHDRDDRPRPRADRPRARLVAPGGDRRRADHGGQRAGARGLRRRTRRLAGPFDMVFIDALKPEYQGYLEALERPAGAGRAHRGRQRPVERPRPGRDRRNRTTRMRQPCARSMPPAGRPPVHARRSCRSATACSSPRGAADEAAVSIRVRVRLFAVQRELAGTREVPLELPTAPTSRRPGPRSSRHPSWRPGRGSLRFARNGDYADPTTALTDGDEVAMIPPVSVGRRTASGRGTLRAPAAGGSSSCAKRRSRPTILAELADALAVPEDGAVVGFLGRTRSTPGTPAPGQEAEAARHAGRSVESLEYEALDTLALATLATIADEIAARFGVDRLGDRPPRRRGAARRGVDRRRRRRAASRRRIRGGALCDRRDEGPRADLEGRTVRRRARLDRPPGTDRTRAGRVTRRASGRGPY